MFPGLAVLPLVASTLLAYAVTPRMECRAWVRPQVVCSAQSVPEAITWRVVWCGRTTDYASRRTWVLLTLPDGERAGALAAADRAGEWAEIRLELPSGQTLRAWGRWVPRRVELTSRDMTMTGCGAPEGVRGDDATDDRAGSDR